MTRVRLDPRTVALGALRLPVGGKPEAMYNGTGIDGTPAQKYRAVEQLFRQAFITRGAQDGDYAVLDAYDEEGDIIADYGIPDRNTFKSLYRKLNWQTSRLKEER